MTQQTTEKMRLDKWLWAVRFFKTRSIASTEVGRNRVKVNEQSAKPARDIRIGDEIFIQRGTGQNATETTVIVQNLSEVRGPASIAQTLYAETAESVKLREETREKRRFTQEPAATIVDGRPTKRDRRNLAEWKRWSASAD